MWFSNIVWRHRTFPQLLYIFKHILFIISKLFVHQCFFLAHNDTVIYISHIIRACVQDTNETTPTVFLFLHVFNHMMRSTIPVLFKPFELLDPSCSLSLKCLWKNACLVEFSQIWFHVTYSFSWFSIIVGLYFPLKKISLILKICRLPNVWTNCVEFKC